MVSRPRFDDTPGPAPEPVPPERPEAPDAREGLSTRAEVQFLAIAVVGALLLLLSGLPGGREPLAGDGSDDLRLGWASRLESPAPVPTEGAPQDPPAPAERSSSTAPR